MLAYTEIVTFVIIISLTETSVEAQWIQIFQGSKFPSGKDQENGILPNLGEIELSKSLMTASNYSDLPGKL